MKMIARISAFAFAGALATLAAICCADSTGAAPTTASAPAVAAAPVASAISTPVPVLPQILLDRSIFSREQRRAQRPRVYRPEPPRVVVLPSPIFTGAIYDQTEYVAFLEDPDSGKVTFARVGQIYPQGRIETITLDYLMLRPADSAMARRIDLGQNLGGEVPAVSAPLAAVPAAATTTSADATQAAPGAAATPSAAGSAEDSIIERMKRRRQQESQGN